MYLCITDLKLCKSKALNASQAAELIGVERAELYRMKRNGVAIYKHFSIVYDVEIVKKKPSGKPLGNAK